MTNTKTKYKPIKTRRLWGGIQKIFRFANGYGASVVKHAYSYGGDKGLWELAVIKFYGNDWRLCYETPITDDVEGWLTWDKVEELLAQIKKLPQSEG